MLEKDEHSYTRIKIIGVQSCFFTVYINLLGQKVASTMINLRSRLAVFLSFHKSAVIQKNTHKTEDRLGFYMYMARNNRLECHLFANKSDISMSTSKKAVTRLTLSRFRNNLSTAHTVQ